ncbi:MAG: fatty acid--CoA ligase family protein [Bacilli bacterium]|nr:fatty acid--CoA ligase family protein [Bacilli bacterium]
MDLFYSDISKNQEITWDILLDDLNNTTEYNPYCYQQDFYSVFKHIILSLLLEKEIILLDSDFSEEEIQKLTGLNNLNKNIYPIKKSKKQVIENKAELIDLVKNVGSNWSMTLFTSGTTGLPKKVVHSFQSITRFVKTSETNKTSVWGFAYNPTHMAGIQVFFQALLNDNPIIRIFGLSKEQTFNSIEKFDITNISATPTFYRLLVPAQGHFTSVKRITSGGEKFDEKTAEQLKQIFPNAKFTNVYASTEAGTLFAAVGNNFSIKPEMNPFVQIQDNELLIHKSLLGKSAFSDSEWYHTGDIVKIISENPLQFQFVSRKNEMINVGGYKVNPGEVEETIRKIKGIQDVRVFAKSNSVLGNIICCEVVKTSDEIDEVSIRSFLQSKLQEFKIPRIIKFTNQISTTRTGKIKRS